MIEVETRIDCLGLGEYAWSELTEKWWKVRTIGAYTITLIAENGDLWHAPRDMTKHVKALVHDELATAARLLENELGARPLG